MALKLVTLFYDFVDFHLEKKKMIPFSFFREYLLRAMEQITLINILIIDPEQLFTRRILKKSQGPTR